MTGSENNKDDRFWLIGSENNKKSYKTEIFDI
jgi:hypothetical protein